MGHQVLDTVTRAPRAGASAGLGGRRQRPIELLTLYVKLAYNRTMTPKTERLSLRLTSQQDAVLRRAAQARGESMNDFVLRHAVEAAETELADRRVFAVDDATWVQLQELLSAPPALPEAMVKLLSNPSDLENHT